MINLKEIDNVIQNIYRFENDTLDFTIDGKVNCVPTLVIYQQVRKHMELNAEKRFARINLPLIDVLSEVHCNNFVNLFDGITFSVGINRELGTIYIEVRW